MYDDDIIEKCEQLALLRSDISTLKKLEKELSEDIKNSIGGRGIIRDRDGRRICQVSTRRKRTLGTRLKFFKPWLRDFLASHSE